VLTSVTLGAEADARVLQSNPDTNYGTLSRLDVDSPGEESYIRFAVSGVSGAVQNATLRLFATNGSSNGPSLYLTGNSWTETGITWNNRPAPTTGVIADAGVLASNAWAEYDVTAQVTGDGTYSFVLQPDSSNGVTFESREGSPPPELVLTFTSGPAPTPTNTPLSTDTSTATNTPLPTNTPTVGPSPTPTDTPTNTPVPPTPTPTNTPTVGPSPTPTNTPTNTPVPPTPTPTNTPTITPTPTNTPASTGVTLAAEADAEVQQNNPDTNYGTSTSLNVDSPGEESYIRFSVSGVSGTVQSAILRLFVSNASSDGPGIYGTGNSWAETGITWNNRPAPTTGALANIGVAAPDTWVEYDLTGHITGDGIYSFVFLPDSSDGIRFESREGSPPPELVLTFASEP
jgi:hypothetical protein